MGPRTDPGLVRAFNICSRITSLSVLGTGTLVLVGWVFHVEVLRSFLPSFPPMNVRNALALAMAGTSLWVAQREKATSGQRKASWALAGFTGLIGLLTIFEYVFGLIPAIDQFLLHETPGPLESGLLGSVSPQAGASLVLIAGALITLDMETARGWRPAQWLSLIVGLVSMLALIGFAFSIPALCQLSRQAAVSLPTGLALLLLSSGILFARPDQGSTKHLVCQCTGGGLARRLLNSLEPSNACTARKTLKARG